MSAKIFSYPLVIKEIYLDTFGHVNNATYLTLFEEARWELITQNGYGMAKIQESGLGPTILEIKITFLRELRLRDEIVINTQMLAYEKKIGKLSQQMVRNGELCCQAELIIGLFDLQTRKLVLPTEDWLHAVGM
ncbi:MULTISPECIES: acyl-CoA thioesterase [Legionella]|uniref:Acyl-CoA thioesterase n=1 Tax=Legionella septentrionalis TaxID=2498109 RepID=A0A3S1CMR5_9GAMM|nr:MULTISPECIES: thioesterase family protein [Legionella]MCP0913112.1 acyl-CoA thioesterase [Legionella sp. 27cVA30]RUQ91562.1 acyl-CoA thioesterase [Legionella septentrionalis]RUQ94693.1 acyl-CoA thioesterase [Legionella septentrionalis]RUR10612.1 acyl-CoA thioesterase [Legionella septentrionalis]RUR17159.1 acyl-CoA thioesterase [Legionella septentrionalis]